MYEAYFYGGVKDKRVFRKPGKPKEEIVFSQKLPCKYSNSDAKQPVAKEHKYKLSRVIYNEKYIYEYVETKSIYEKDSEET
jgi:hypothetical protein